MVLKRMMNVLNVEKVVIGLENVPIDNHLLEEQNILIQDQDIEDQRDQIQGLVHILLIHLLIQEGEGMQRREVGTTEEVEAQEEIIRERKVPVAEDHKAIQGPDLQLAINNVSHISHHHLNEKGSNQEKKKLEIKSILFFHFLFSLSLSFWIKLYHFLSKDRLNQLVLKQQPKKFIIQYIKSNFTINKSKTYQLQISIIQLDLFKLQSFSDFTINAYIYKFQSQFSY
ncbi:unnamed protein product [Paramecium octaurelia]|uniref:Transmembrane protein n=1 Tax=Paramecium octaurelia TaxID=43137 RepID=A0A8S1USE0_PAROT|nr:unnamed protein product [Paramecium octaurelia]